MNGSVAKQSLILAFADFTKKSLLGVTVLVSIRFLPATVFGDFIFLISFYQIFAVIAGAGIPNALVRDVATHGVNQPGLLTGSTLGRAAYVAPAACIMYAVMFFSGYPQRYLAPLGILVLLMLVRGCSDNIMAIFQGNHDQVSAAKIGIAQSVVTLIAVIVVCVLWKDLVALLAAYVVGAFAAWFTGLALLEHKHRGVWEQEWSAAWDKFRYIMKDSTWLNGGAFAASAYNRADVLLLRRMSTVEAVALYSAPYRILDIAQIIPNSIMGVLLPRWCTSEGREMSSARVTRLLLVLALLIIVVINVSAPWFAPLIFGPSYRASTPLLQILIWALLPMFWNFTLNSRLIAVRRESALTSAALGALVLNVALNYLFIPEFGFYACAAITLVTESALLIMNTAFLCRCRRFEIPESPLRLVLATTFLAAFCILWLHSQSSVNIFTVIFLVFGVLALPIHYSDLPLGLFHSYDRRPIAPRG